MDRFKFYWRALSAPLAIRWLPTRSPLYWLGAFAFLGISLMLESPIEGYLNVDRFRDYLFQNLNEATMNRSRAGALKLVMIGDDDYWDPNGLLKFRSPTNRKYLANVVVKLSAVNASVIAIDFDMHLHDPYASVDPKHPENMIGYFGETEAFIQAVHDAAETHRIVLPRTLMHNADGYFLAADVVQAFGICVRPTGNGTWYNPGTKKYPLSAAARSNISCGYIALTPDPRRIPPPIAVQGHRGLVDSFSLAIARAVDPANMSEFSDRPYYETYIRREILEGKNTTVSSHVLLACCKNPAKPDASRALLQGNAVIVGAGWTPTGGQKVDVHKTPVGTISGAMIHFNGAAAALAGRLFPAIDAWWLFAINAGLGVMAVIGFAALANGWWRLAALFGATGILFALQWLSLNLFGVFIDAFIPVFGVGLHSLIERLVSRE